MDEVRIQTKFGNFLLRKFLEGKIRKNFGRTVEIGKTDISIQHQANDKIRADLSISVSMTEAEFGALIEQLIGG